MGNTYTAVTAKVRALYGGRMTAEDYRQLMSKKTISQAASFLSTHSGYRNELTGLSTSDIHREQLENVLRKTYMNEYRRIFSFLSMEDKELLRFPVYRAEKEVILTAMRRLSSRSTLEPETTWSSLLSSRSRLDLAELSQAKSFAQIADAAKNTIYASVLTRSMDSSGNAPSMAFVDNVLLVTYYAHLYKILGKHYSGQAKKIVKQSLDQETDLLNLVLFLRLKKYFSQEDVKSYSFPLPCSPKLRREYIQQLLSAADYETVWNLVCTGPYGTVFRSQKPTGVEAYLYSLQYSFDRRQLCSADPTIYTPIAYLGLKEIELRNIISIIECIRYQVDPSAYVTLIGVSER